MRRKRLILAPLTALAALALASPAPAADFGVGVTDFKFTPATQSIAVGDQVVWTFNATGHTTTSAPGQPESWDSDIENIGASFSRTFTKPGRYQYVCTPHESFMKGTIVVGTDGVARTAGAITTKVSGKNVTVSFRLNEAAKATWKITGASSKTVTRKRLKAGSQSITVKRLKAGSYRGTLTLTDDFDKKTTKKKSFTVR